MTFLSTSKMKRGMYLSAKEGKGVRVQVKWALGVTVLIYQLFAVSAIRCGRHR